MSTAEWAQFDPSPDPIIERYKIDVDRTLIRENLRKSHQERLLTLQRMQAFCRRASNSRKDDSTRRMIEFRRLLESWLLLQVVMRSSPTTCAILRA